MESGIELDGDFRKIIVGVVREGTKIRLKLPSEIHGLIPAKEIARTQSLEEMDFFNGSENRPAILRRENNKCFYCLRSVDPSNYVIEHTISRPGGDNGYRNVVAACRSCNNRKGDIPPEDYLRVLHRNDFLSAEEFEARIEALRRLTAGELKPIL